MLGFASLTPTYMGCWLLRETEKALLVAQNLGDVSGDWMQFSGGTEIARRQIVQLEEITCLSWVEKVLDGSALE
jgi:hypothetical protein